MADDKSTTPSIEELIGTRFGNLVVLGRTHHQFCLCICDCGISTEVIKFSLLDGNTKSCGCAKAALIRASKTKHGLEPSTEYTAWQAAKNRCYNPNYRRYDRYGGRGIAMCEEWRNDFTAFFRDMGPRPEGMELDRIDNDGPYSANNCRWTDHKTQTRNQSRAIRITHNGETLLLKEWAERTGIPYRRLYYLYRNGKDLFAAQARSI